MNSSIRQGRMYHCYLQMRYCFYNSVRDVRKASEQNLKFSQEDELITFFSTAKNLNKLHKSRLDCSEAFLVSHVDTQYIAFGSISKLCSISQIVGTEY